jgi:hypothetical protein
LWVFLLDVDWLADNATLSSAFIDWAKKQIEGYADMFRKQVYSSDVDPKVVEEALRITHTQSKKVFPFLFPLIP